VRPRRSASKGTVLYRPRNPVEIFCAAWSPDGGHIATGDFERLLQKCLNGIIMVSCASNALLNFEELSGMCSRVAPRGMRRIAGCTNNEWVNSDHWHRPEL
jgi:hypothetical protein